MKNRSFPNPIYRYILTLEIIDFTDSAYVTVFNEDADSYDSEIIALREKRGYDSVGPENFCEVMQFDREKAITIVREQLDARGAKNIRILADQNT